MARGGCAQPIAPTGSAASLAAIASTTVRVAAASAMATRPYLPLSAPDPSGSRDHDLRMIDSAGPDIPTNEMSPACDRSHCFGMRVARSLHRVGDAVEGRGEVGADQLHRGDDHHGDAGGDQAVLDGGRTGLVLHEPREHTLHLLAP